MPVLTTVGKTAGGSSTTTSSADKLIASKFNASAGGGTLTAGHARVWLSASGTANAKMVVYADSSGSPGAKLATSDQLAITATTEGVRDFVFTGAQQITIQSAADYWIALTWADPGTPSITYSRDNTSSQRLERSDITYGTPPDPFGTATGTFSGPIDVWVDLNGTTSGSGGTGGSATQPTVRNTQTGGKTTGTNTSVSVTKPTGLVAGDYLLAISVGDADVVLSSMTAPSGFTTLSSQAGNASSNYPNVAVFGKAATSTDAAASSFSFGFDANGDGVVILAAITTGTYDTSTPVAVGTFTTTPRTSTTLQTAPSMTGVVDGLLMWVFGTDTNNTTESYPSSPTTPSGTTLLATVQGTAHYAMAGAYYKGLAGAGATGTATVTPTGAGTTNGWTSTVVMVNPKTTGGSSGGSGGATVTMGKTTAGSTSTASTADKTAVSSATASTSGTLTAGHAHSWLSATGSANTKVVVYADSSGAPGAKLAESDVVAITLTADALTNYTFSGANRIAITNGTTYWVGLAWQDPGTPSLNLGRDATTNARQEVASYAPDPFGTPTAQTGPVAVYVDIVEPGGGGSTGTEGYTLLATTTSTSYLDTSVATASGQTLGVGGIPTAAAGSGVVLVTADSSSRLSITTSNRVYDGQGHSVAGITISADNVTVQNFRIHGANRDAVSITGSGVTVQNCDLYGVTTDGSDINAITLFGDGHKILYNTVGVTDFLVSGDPGGSHTDFVQTWNTSSKRSTSNLVVQGNRIVGPANSDNRYFHQGVQGEGKGSTDGGGGGSGTSSGWLIADNSFELGGANHVFNFLDIHNVEITRNTFIGTADVFIGTGDGSSGIVYYDDNVTTSWTGTTPSTTAGPGPDGPAKPGSGSSGSPVVYSYVVTAVDAAGNESGGGPPGGGTGGPPDTEAPTVPTNLAASTNDGRITVTWDASTDNVGVTQYKVYRSGTWRAYAATTRYVDIDLVNETNYDYTVSALDAAGNESAQSSSVSATATGVPLTGAPMLPGRLTNGKIEVQIAWGADLSADETTWTWSDVTSDVRQHPGISTALGRNDESSTSNPANLTVVLDNSNHDYSLGTLSARYPYVRRGTPVRVRIDPGDGVGGRIVFQGYADGFTPGWDSLKGNLPVATLSASGTLRRLSQGSAPLQSVYRRVMTASPTVKAYWPMEEGKTAQVARAVRGGSDMTLATAGVLLPGVTQGLPHWQEDDSFDCSAPLPRLGTAFLRCDVDAYTDTGASQVRFLLSVPDSGLPDGTVFMHVWSTGTIGRWDLTYQILNGVTCLGLYRYTSPSQSGTLHSSDVVQFPALNGGPCRVSIDWTQSGSNITWTLGLVEAFPGADGLYFRGTISGKTAGIVSHFDINSHNADINATIGHLTVENQITSFFTDQDALVANFGEDVTSDTGRLIRLCTENGVPLQRYIGVVSPIITLDRMGPQLPAPLLDLLRECEISNQGQLWDGRAAGLQYTTRKRRQLGTVKLTIDAAAGQLAGEFIPVDDDQRDRNKVTVTRLHGATYTYEDVLGPKGTAAIGIYDDAVTVNCYDDASTVDFARWFVLLGTVEGYRYPSVTVDLAASPDLAPAVLDIIPGERIDVANLDTTLAGFPTNTVSLIVEGIAHEITTRTWQATFRCSLFAPWAIGIEGGRRAIANLAAVTPKLRGALTATVGGGVPVSGALAATTPKPSAALVTAGAVTGALAATAPQPTGALTATTSGGGVLSDLTSQSFTDSGGLAGSYHFYGGGLPTSGAGLVVYLDGDDMYAYLNPTDNYALAGNRGLITVAKAKGYALLVPEAPDTTGAVTWWEAGARNAQWLSELMASIYSTKGIDNTKVWMVGYSGGAQVLTQHFMPLYGKTRVAGGGALVLGGGAAAVSTPVGWDSTLKAAVPMYWITGAQDDGTYSPDGYDALTDANAGKTYYAGQGFTTTLTSPAGLGHELDGSFGPMLDDLLPTLSGYSPPSRTPGSTRPTLVTSYKVTGTGTATTTTSSFTPSAGEVIVVKAWNPDLDSPNVASVVGGSLTYATKFHVEYTNFAECWVFVAEVGATSPGAMTVSASWAGTSGQHGIVVERWSSGLVKGVPKQGSPIHGSGAPSSSVTPDSANSVLTWMDVDWNVTSGTAAYRSGATETQQSSTSNVRAYAAYQNSTGTSAQTVGLTAPTGQAWTLGAIELLPAP